MSVGRLLLIIRRLPLLGLLIAIPISILAAQPRAHGAISGRVWLNGRVAGSGYHVFALTADKEILLGHTTTTGSGTKLSGSYRLEPVPTNVGIVLIVTDPQYRVLGSSESYAKRIVVTPGAVRTANLPLRDGVSGNTESGTETGLVGASLDAFLYVFRLLAVKQIADGTWEDRTLTKARWLGRDEITKELLATRREAEDARNGKHPADANALDERARALEFLMSLSATPEGKALSAAGPLAPVEDVREHELPLVSTRTVQFGAHRLSVRLQGTGSAEEYYNRALVTVSREDGTTLLRRHFGPAGRRVEEHLVEVAVPLINGVRVLELRWAIVYPRGDQTHGSERYAIDRDGFLRSWTPSARLRKGQTLSRTVGSGEVVALYLDSNDAAYVTRPGAILVGSGVPKPNDVLCEFVKGVFDIEVEAMVEVDGRQFAHRAHIGYFNSDGERGCYKAHITEEFDGKKGVVLVRNLSSRPRAIAIRWYPSSLGY